MASATTQLAQSPQQHAVAIQQPIPLPPPQMYYHGGMAMAAYPQHGPFAYAAVPPMALPYSPLQVFLPAGAPPSPYGVAFAYPPHGHYYASPSIDMSMPQPVMQLAAPAAHASFVQVQPPQLTSTPSRPPQPPHAHASSAAPGPAASAAVEQPVDDAMYDVVDPSPGVPGWRDDDDDDDDEDGGDDGGEPGHNRAFPDKKPKRRGNNAFTAAPGEITYCKFCPYSSESPINVTRHERTHTGVKPFACQHCAYRSARSAAWREDANTPSPVWLTVAACHAVRSVAGRGALTLASQLDLKLRCAGLGSRSGVRGGQCEGTAVSHERHVFRDSSSSRLESRPHARATGALPVQSTALLTCVARVRCGVCAVMRAGLTTWRNTSFGTRRRLKKSPSSVQSVRTRQSTSGRARLPPAVTNFTETNQ